MTLQPKEYIITEAGMNTAIALLKAAGRYDDAIYVLGEIRPAPAPQPQPQPDKCSVVYCGIQTGTCAFLPDKQKCPLVAQQPPAPSALDELVAWLKEDSDSTYRITGQRLLSHECVLDKIAALRAREREQG